MQGNEEARRSSEEVRLLREALAQQVLLQEAQARENQQLREALAQRDQQLQEVVALLRRERDRE